MNVMGTALLVVGIILFLIGSIEFIVAAFRVSIWWGLGVLFLPLVELIFLIARFYDAWPATKKVILAACMVTAGRVVMRM